MQYTTLGSSGVKISRIALGCMSFGDTSRGFNQWALDDAAAEPLFRQAVELDITFWDTANAYGYGTSEEIVGRAISKYTRREDVVLATKVFVKMHDGPGGSGLSRRAILEQLDDSLRRLGTDYVDLYQIHRFDPAAPVEETMEALHDMVKAGKVRYLGASSMWAWQFSKMQYTAQLHGWTRFVSMQNQYSLMQREEEREMFGLLADQGVGSIPWSPLAKGRLARPWGEQTARSDTDDVARWVLPHDDKAIADAVQRIAEQHGVPMAQIALAWVLRNPVVSAPHRRRYQTAAPRRRRGRTRPHPHRRRDQRPGGALHPAAAHRLLIRYPKGHTCEPLISTVPETSASSTFPTLPSSSQPTRSSASSARASADRTCTLTIRCRSRQAASR
jgi:1-deoxyxylulose-5-phosphate synthase